MAKISEYDIHNPAADAGLEYLPANVAGETKKVLGSSLGTFVGAQRSRTIADTNQYAQLQIAFTTDDGWTYVGYCESSAHITAGPTMLTRTRDGSTWDTPWEVVVPGAAFIKGVPTFGVSGNRIIFTFQEVVAEIPTYQTIFFAYSDDGGQTWTLADSVGLAGAKTEVFCYGNVKRIKTNADGNHVLVAPAYANWSVDPSQAYFYISHDNGLTWAIGTTIKQGIAADVFPGGAINETWIEVIEEGATLATTKLLALVRSEKYYTFHYQLYSNDGGATWVDLGVTLGKWFTEANALDSLGGPDVGANTYPVAMIRRGEWIYVVYGHRGIHGLDAGDLQVRVIKGKALEVYNNPDNWSLPEKHYFAVAGVKSFANDFGYCHPFLIAGQLFTTLYDNSVKYHLSGSGTTTTKTRIITIPLEGNNYFEGYAVDDQAIPHDAETTVVIPATRYDSERALNETTDKVEIQEDGWYIIHGRLLLQASAAGTYREAKLLMIDPGDEDGLTPSAMAGKYLIAKAAIPPSAVSRLCRIELSGQQWLYKGSVLRLTIRQDSGGSLNVVNSTSRDDRANLKYVKIR